MKVPLEWLKDLVDFGLRPEALAERMTMSGLEVGAIEYHGGDIEGVVVGKVKAAEKLASDHHLVCQIDTGKKMIQVITDDLTLQPGDRVPVAAEGARIAGGIAIVKTELHGVGTFGYLCKPHELGLYEENSVLRLPKDAVLGDDVKKYLGPGGCVLDIDILPNRGDCQSLLGIAREVAAVLDKKLKFKHLKIKRSSARPPVPVSVKNKPLCPRYMARKIEGVTIKDSPDWIKDRLLLLGMRPINNVVDVTNYLLAELGQPMHAFDADLIKGGIIVREAAKDEKLKTLDGTERKLAAGTLVIADEEKAVALAGVMGGANSEVSSSTVNVLLESACFDPVAISKTSKQTKLRTEASVRFEKGIDWEMVEEALERAAAMIAELSGGKVAEGRADVKAKDRKPQKIGLRAKSIERILGTGIPIAEAVKILKRLGFKCVKAQKSSAMIEVPLYRARDIEREIDLIEEVVRIRGYEKIGTSFPRVSRADAAADAVNGLKLRTREILAGCGLSEAVTFSLVGPEMAGPKAIVVSNPMTAEESVMRTAVLPSLMKVLSHNLRHQIDDIRIFEVGTVYLPSSGRLPEERLSLAGVMCGKGIDFYEIKGVIENLIGTLAGTWSLESVADDRYHPGKSAAIIGGKADRLLGRFGALHPETAKKWDIKQEVFAFEIDLQALAGAGERKKNYRPLPKFPKVERDLAMFVPPGTASKSIIGAIRKTGGELVEDVRLFDRYQNSQAYRISFRDPARTLTDEEVSRKFDAIIAELEANLGVKIRK